MFKEIRTIRVKGGVNINERDRIYRLVLFMVGANNVKTLEAYDRDGNIELIIVAKMKHSTWLKVFYEIAMGHEDTCYFDM
jgi:hypothetical protein